MNKGKGKTKAKAKKKSKGKANGKKPKSELLPEDEEADGGGSAGAEVPPIEIPQVAVGVEKAVVDPTNWKKVGGRAGIPKDLKDALAKALAEIEAEDAAAGCRPNALEEDPDNKPFASKPPSASSDPRVLRRQKIMLERMRKKQSDRKEKQLLALIDPAAAENCKKYNLTVNQLRAVRRINLRLPHECRDIISAHEEEISFKEEDVLFEDNLSLEDMLGRLKQDEKFMEGQNSSKIDDPPRSSSVTTAKSNPPRDSPQPPTSRSSFW